MRGEAVRPGIVIDLPEVVPQARDIVIGSVLVDVLGLFDSVRTDQPVDSV
ncbi:hypothetical protein Y023_6362 [Burkholderia pseudomallei A79D]|nr:hypothetical protein Y046_5724 [Burkholderia pseudomallei MSHR2990]KGY04052.1 hypothetical protein Y023_6362 [Burkholderia pseudomallei A79D]KGY04497.1 hypothetical protein X997_6369 [Burkholderia pseudomallei A79C]